MNNLNPNPFTKQELRVLLCLVGATEPTDHNTIEGDPDAQQQLADKIRFMLKQPRRKNGKE